MLQIFVNANYDFVGKRRWFYAASLAAVVLALLSIAAAPGPELRHRLHRAAP